MLKLTYKNISSLKLETLNGRISCLTIMSSLGKFIVLTESIPDFSIFTPCFKKHPLFQ